MATVCYFLFPESPRRGLKMEAEKKSERTRREEEGQMSKKDEDNEQEHLGNLGWRGGNRGDMTEMVSKGENKGQKMAGRAMEGTEGVMVMGQEGRHMRGGRRHQ